MQIASQRYLGTSQLVVAQEIKVSATVRRYHQTISGMSLPLIICNASIKGNCSPTASCQI